MTGNQLLKFLRNQPAETLEKELLFETIIHSAPDHHYAGQVPIIEGNILPDDFLLTPEGLLTSEDAMLNYEDVKAGLAIGESTPEEVETYKPFNCPLWMRKGQLLFKLQEIKAYNDSEPEIASETASLLTFSWNKNKGEA